MHFSPIALTSYSVVVSLHVMAALSAYGLPLAYPMLLPYIRRNHPRALPGLHDVQHRLNLTLTGPGTVLLFGFGVYLASKGHHWGETWVAVPLAILGAIVVLGGGVIVPATARLSELAHAAVEAAGGAREISFSAEYESVYARYMMVERLLGVLVLVAVFFMAAKPFA